MGDKLHHKRRDGRSKRAEEVRKQRATTWLILCEGEKTEPNYFRGLAKYLKLKKIKIEAHGEGKNTGSLVSSVEELLGFHDKIYGKMKVSYGKLIFVFDADSFGASKFNSAIKTAQTKHPESIVGWSNESFELWMCLHFDFIDAALHRSGYNDKLTKIFRKHNVITKRQNYKDHVSNRDDLFELILSCGGSIEIAIKNAEKLILGKNMDNPSKVNPSTMVHEVVKALIDESATINSD